MTFNDNSRCGCGTKAVRIYCGSPACARCIALEQAQERRIARDFATKMDRSPMGFHAMTRAINAWMHRLGMRPSEFAYYSTPENPHHFRAHKPPQTASESSPQQHVASNIPSALGVAAGAISSR